MYQKEKMKKNDNEIKVHGVLGALFDSPRYAEKMEGDIRGGDCIVIDGIIQIYDEYYFTENIDWSKITKVKKPAWL